LELICFYVVFPGFLLPKLFPRIGFQISTELRSRGNFHVMAALAIQDTRDCGLFPGNSKRGLVDARRARSSRECGREPNWRFFEGARLP